MNAALAADAGLEAKPASRPPALYAYDPDIGRLAVTTPSYNTAIIAVSQGAFPYGGIDLARLFDGDQEVAATIGGRPPGAFGLVARRGDGRIVLATQRARRRLNRRVTPLRLIRAPRGVGVRAGTTARRAYAGPFTDLRTAGTVRARGLRATSRYRFTPDRIDARWTLARTAPGRRVVAEVGFPSWGAGATAVAELRDGRTLTVRRTPVPLRSVRSVRIVSARGSYTIVPVAAPPRARIGHAAHASPAVRATRRSDAHRRARLTHRRSGADVRGAAQRCGASMIPESRRRPLHAAISTSATAAMTISTVSCATTPPPSEAPANRVRTVSGIRAPNGPVPDMHRISLLKVKSLTEGLGAAGRVAPEPSEEAR